MTGGRKKKAVKDCCCVGTCCCLPLDMTNPLYPNGVKINIPFEVSAPGCPTIDGRTGTFRPIDPTSVVKGGCGACGSYSPIAFATLAGSRRVSVGDACLFTPCNINVCFMLTCEISEEAGPGELDECCSRIRLWIGSSELQQEDDGSRPSVDLTAVSCSSWKKVSSTHCVCDPDFSARFPLALNFVCGIIQTGPCAGESDCCTVTCDLTGAEVLI